MNATGHAAGKNEAALDPTGDEGLEQPDDGAAGLGALNAAHASPTALAHASSKSIVGAIAAYKSAMITAQADVSKYTTLVSQDQAAVAAAQANLTALQASKTSTATQISDAQAQLTAAQQQLASDQAQLAAAQAEITSAQNTLASSSNKQLTPDAITRINALLGLSS